MYLGAMRKAKVRRKEEGVVLGEDVKKGGDSRQHKLGVVSDADDNGVYPDLEPREEAESGSDEQVSRQL
jgi:hypothetical protein